MPSNLMAFRVFWVSPFPHTALPPPPHPSHPLSISQTQHVHMWISTLAGKARLICSCFVLFFFLLKLYYFDLEKDNSSHRANVTGVVSMQFLATAFKSLHGSFDRKKEALESTRWIRMLGKCELLLGTASQKHSSSSNISHTAKHGILL